MLLLSGRCCLCLLHGRSFFKNQPQDKKGIPHRQDTLHRNSNVPSKGVHYVESAQKRFLHRDRRVAVTAIATIGAIGAIATASSARLQ